MDKAVEDAFNQYMQVLKDAGAALPHLIVRMENPDEIDQLNEVKGVTIPNQLRSFLILGSVIDKDLSYKYDAAEPEFAWNMTIRSVKWMERAYKESPIIGMNDDEDYWPKGFLPLLYGASGDEMTINCNADSPTYGAVYLMEEGVGVNRVSDDLVQFIKASQAEIEQGFRVFNIPAYSENQDVENWFAKLSAIYGNTPYFDRPGRFDQQVIDWK